MQVLIVDCWDKENFKTFKRIVKRTICQSLFGEGNEPNFIVRSIDELSDYACHWEHDTLDEKSKGRMSKFDKLDMIFICGDMRTVPWDPMYMQVITLIFMAVSCRKVSFPSVVMNLFNVNLSCCSRYIAADQRHTPLFIQLPPKYGQNFDYGTTK
jgi:hypothetical protein